MPRADSQSRGGGDEGTRAASVEENPGRVVPGKAAPVKKMLSMLLLRPLLKGRTRVPLPGGRASPRSPPTEEVCLQGSLLAS